MEENNPMQVDTMQDAMVDVTTNVSDMEAANKQGPEATETPADNPAEPEVDYSAMSREELVEALRALLTDEVQNIKHRVAAIRSHWDKLMMDENNNVQPAAEAAPATEAEEQNVPSDDTTSENDQPSQNDDKEDAVAHEFRKLVARYREMRNRYIEQLEEQKRRNLASKQALIEELRELVENAEEQVRPALDRFNSIQERWKAIGDVPREEMNDLWQNYHFQIEQFFGKLKINRELRALDQKRNLEEKIVLCERAEELIMEPSVNKAFKGLQELRARWKEIGPVPVEQNEEIWQRFCAAANEVDRRRREYYEQRKEEYDNNLLAKQALVEKATELTEKRPDSTKEWNEVTTALDELLKMWKTIGPVPREVNEEIWQRFKGLIDKHYSDKKEYFSSIRDEQEANYQKKVELCLKAEAIVGREDWKKATQELIELQQEWKTIGATSRKVSEKVWHRFRKACDAFFAKKSEFFEERRSSEEENLAKKEAILAELKAHVFGDNKDENLSAIKDFQRRWAEVGFVPMADKERLHKEFRGEIDRIFEQLKINAREAEETAYRQRIQNAGGDAARFVMNEKQELQERIEKLRSDLALWENNLGFLANSKQADLLKQEFEKKMQGARQQIALLQAKIRILIDAEKAEKADKNSDNQ
ncbi:MAG: DUF349 domain-containing protein [Bacteroidales bacterium]|nr:DUF349 domain-containing protein [Bacteroidales bacterium]